MTALLFCDFETTSLETSHATLLEGAWCVTDLDGIQRTPLRSRYLEIAPEGEDAVHPDGGGWHPVGGGQLAALQMAEVSGLHDDWQACPRSALITRAADLERLILEDVLASCDQGDRLTERSAEYVHICGPGAARFDFTLLAMHCPGLMPPPGFRTPVHYRPVDTSGNQTGLLGNNYEKEIIAWYMREWGNAETHPLGKNLGIELGDWPSFCFPDTNVACWLTNDTCRHRSPVDVARSIIVQRALWNYGKNLRAELGLPEEIPDPAGRALRAMWRAGRGR